jgi:dCTP deaminase
MRVRRAEEKLLEPSPSKARFGPIDHLICNFEVVRGVPFMFCRQTHLAILQTRRHIFARRRKLIRAGGMGKMGGILPDWQIEKRIRIEPFAPQQSRKGIISYGLTSYGYDARVDRHFKVFTNARCTIVDPKNFDPLSFVDIEADFCLIPPNSFALAETIEFFEIPRDILCVCLGKSTYARCGIIVNVTPLEPEWRGRVTIEISNTTPLPAKIYAGEGIAQFLFFEATSPCRTSYADKGGKYQDQKGLTLPFVLPS